MSEANFAVATEADLASYFTASRTGLVNFAQSLTRDRGRSEDIVAEAYIQVVGMIRRGKGPTAEKLEPYVKVCVRNEAFRQAKRNSNEVPTPIIEALVDEMIETVSEPDHNGTWDEEAATRAFHTLSPRSQSILRLTTIQGQRVSAVSEQLGMSERAVVSAAFRARQNLRTRYLVEVTADSHNCRDIRIDYLASFARDQASTRREKKISAHIQHCSSCEQTLRRMRALRLPATVIVGIAATASVMSPHAGSSAQAAELAQKDQALQAIGSGSGSATPR
ncbi:sigma-70 family RNA polymerase sigma factor [Leucobacter coleopterorum]|uniref:Sigma-70 family RNA polymerase sigma factor n=1 Tax=Leucobacter coleopterorum TaxID=2714933 RepID=A0ABX6JXV3_9MICO|nr:sigma-70 family RNA polymerase sigma factor [Leucobacter coleopterorum]QIM19052.1 sigma-70 family RNA polymerase sigma factor [Leucobacter coleopterorum]